MLNNTPLCKIKIRAVLAALISLQSCSPVIMNIPVTHSLPMLSNRGEIECSGNFGLTGLNVDGAYALTNHFFAGGNFNTYDHLKMYELNGGYYLKINQRNRFELQCGGDLGSQSGKGEYTTIDDYGNIYSYAMYSFQTHYASMFIQPALAKIGRISEYGIALRFELMTFPGFYCETQENFAATWMPPANTFINNWNNQLFVTPILFWTIGYKYVKIKLQYSIGGTVPNYNNNPLELISSPFQPYQNGYVSIGLQVRLFHHWDKE